MRGVGGWERSGEHSSPVDLPSYDSNPVQWCTPTIPAGDLDQEFKREKEASAQQVLLRDRARRTRCQLPVPRL